MNPEELLAHVDFVQSLARSLVADVNKADDIEQQTWLAALESPPVGKKPIRLWLSKVALNFAKLMYRKEQRRKRHERATSGQKFITPPDKVVEREETRRSLIDAVLSLDDPYRTAILLRYYDGLPPREMAKHLNMPLERVKTHLKRGLAQLRHKLDTQHGGDRRKWLMALVPLAGVKVGGEASAATGTSAALMGVLAMSTKVKVVVATVLVIGTFLILWQVFSEPSPYTSPFKKFNSIDIHSGTGEESILSEREPAPMPSEREPVISDLVEVKITGQVISRLEGKAIKDARVVATLLPRGEQEGSVEDLTDAEGIFDLRCLLSNRTGERAVHVAISAPGYRNLHSSIPLEESTQRVDLGVFYIKGFREYGIQVVDLERTPVAGATVYFYKSLYPDPVLKKITGMDGWVRYSDPEIIRNRRILDEGYGLRITKEGMADTYYSKDYFVDNARNQDVPSFPEKIVMEPAGTWRAEVVDAGTGQGLPNVKVTVIIIHDSFSQLTSQIGAITDNSGCFEMPRCRFEGQWYSGEPGFRVCAYTNGYQKTELTKKDYPQLFDEHEIYPTRIELSPDTEMIPCIAVEDGSCQPLSGVTLRMNRREETITDERGRFNISRTYILRDRDFHLLIEIPALKMIHDSWWNVEEFEEKEWEIPFKKLLCRGPRIEVKDEFGQAIGGAQVNFSLYFPYDYYKNSRERHFSAYTDQNGVYISNFNLTEPTECQIKITHPAYLSTESDRFTLGSSIGEAAGDDRERFEFVLHSGFLFQNLQIVNEKGEPVPDKFIEAYLTSKSGEEIFQRGCSDEQGRCNMVFPLFHDGIIQVIHRPDTEAHITYDQLLKQSEVCLILKEELDPENAIEGRVLSPEGIGLKYVSIKYSEMTEKPSWTRISTDKKGMFRFRAFPDCIYQIEVMPTTDGKVTYAGQNADALTAGMELNFTMQTCPGILVEFSAIKKEKGYYPHRYEAYLEDKTGTRLEAERIVEDLRRVVFINPPLNTVRVILETEKGETFSTPFFQVEKGKVVTPPFEFP